MVFHDNQLGTGHKKTLLLNCKSRVIINYSSYKFKQAWSPDFPGRILQLIKMQNLLHHPRCGDHNSK